MIATSHFIIGGAVGVITGAATQNPAAAVAAGFVSHLLCDLIPHWDHPDAPEINGDLVWTRKVWIFAFSDSIFGALVVLALWGLKFNYDWSSMFLWGAAGGYLPDFIDNVPFWKSQIRTLPGFKQFHALHMWVHHTWMFKYPMPKYWVLGTVSQLILVIPALWFLFNR